MAYVILDTCTKDNECIAACPVDCIHPREDEEGYADVPQLYAHPEECIDCGACVPVCESNAVFPLDEVPPEQAGAIEKNATYFGR